MSDALGPPASAGPRRNFGSDNVTGMAPEILASLIAANGGTEHSYGDDPHTVRLSAALCELFETQVTAFPVATGTAANALSLASLVPPYGAVYCHETAHIVTDECGAPEFFSGGAKLIGLAGAHGKLSAASIGPQVDHARAMGVHHVLPAAVSITQATEWGTVYTVPEITSIARAAHDNGLAVHMDGARFANAVASLECSPAECTWRAGVDVLSFGATKNGALAAEVVVFFGAERAAEFALRRKRAGHLWSKLRFLSAQLLAYVEAGLWLRHARNANALAARLSLGLVTLPGALLAAPTQANEVFIRLPDPLIEALERDGYEFYRWPAPPGMDGTVIRLVTAYDMVANDVDALVACAQRHAQQ